MTGQESPQNALSHTPLDKVNRLKTTTNSETWTAKILFHRKLVSIQNTLKAIPAKIAVVQHTRKRVVTVKLMQSGMLPV